MPGFTVEKYEHEPIVLVTYLEAWNNQTDVMAATSAVLALLAAAEEPVFYIVDMTIEPKFKLDDLLTITSQLTRTSNALLKHPNMLEHLLVTRNAVMKLAAKGLSNDAFGGIRGRTFDTLDEALAYARGTS